MLWQARHAFYRLMAVMRYLDSPIDYRACRQAGWRMSTDYQLKVSHSPPSMRATGYRIGIAPARDLPANVRFDGDARCRPVLRQVVGMHFKAMKPPL